MKIKNLVLVTAIAGSAVLASPASQVFAAESNTADSQAFVSLTAGDTTTPVDPIDPSEPGGGTGNTGSLTIDNVTPFEFGTHQISSTSETYTTTSKNPNVQVTDRRGEGQGWTLQVALSEFKDQTDASKVLKGATLTIPKGELKTTAGNVSDTPNNFASTLAADGSGSAIIMQAEEKTGMGTWEDLFNNQEIKLTVPAGNYSGDYSSTLNWSLVDAPNA
ncbi:WxL domain-containing protein [Listeria valentina]|uniref:WxL domain-containing protein n=1 Tax=Listeria valentina TaxID=2705293 RepID=UPI000F075F67|nr:WxL domain-containing protein [Listeria valentina]